MVWFCDCGHAEEDHYVGVRMSTRFDGPQEIECLMCHVDGCECADFTLDDRHEAHG